MRVLIIGCGLIGRKRALALETDDILIACCDVKKEIAGKFAKEFLCKSFTDYEEALIQTDCDTVIVAVINKFIKEIVVCALKLGKNIIAEKPLGRNVSESEDMLLMYKKILISKSIVFKTGFNHRFHSAIWQAKKLVNEGAVGKIFNIRARYGHGGRPGLENEWRSSKDLCGGGELLDQGVHVIDLIRWFSGEVKEVYGKIESKFWGIEVEDNAFAILKTVNDVTASFHVSWTNWKNIFSFEIFGTEGYLRIEGLGGNYGQETLEFGKRKKEGGKPDVELFEFQNEDISWKDEWKEFKKAVKEGREPIGNGLDGLKANAIIDAIYRSSLDNKVVSLD